MAVSSYQQQAALHDVYHTLRDRSLAEIKVKGSRFIGEAMPIADEGEAKAKIAAVQERTYRASHHCTAYRIGVEGDLFRYDDDGEPSGTAGRPILRKIEGRGLTDTLVVVTRFFGGTKLGTGGLARAYADAAEGALAAGRVVRRVLRDAVRLRFGYEDTSPVMRLLHRFDVETGEESYTDETELVVRVRRSEVESFLQAFIEALGGRGHAERL